jgi:hypothetical protein
MPTISMFYGIIIRMLFMDTQQHHLPHIHVEYQGKKAVISIPEGNLLEGDLPAKKLRLVQAWIDRYPRRRVDGGLDAGSEWRTRISD